MSTYTPSHYEQSFDRSQRYGGLAIAIVLHVVVIALLLAMPPVREAVTQAVPIMVRLVSPPQPKAEPRPEVLPKPLPVRPRPEPRPKQVIKPAPKPAPKTVLQPAPKPTPVLTAPAGAPSAVAAPAPAPLPPVEAKPAPAAPAAPPAPPVAAAPPSPPAPVTPPTYNAAYLANPPPAYPALSRRLGEEGKVMLRVFVNEKGAPTDVQLRTSSGHARLDEAALTTVRQWKFVPARRGDEAVPAWVIVPISFSLRS